MTSETGFLMDSGKILSETSKTCLTGKRFYDILLKQYHLQMEMAAGNYVTAIMTCCDTAVSYTHLDVYKRQRRASPGTAILFWKRTTALP